MSVQRNNEFIWFIKHSKELEKYSGEYIAIAGQRIISHGVDFSKVFHEAKQKTEQEPLFHKVPLKNVEVIL